MLPVPVSQHIILFLQAQTSKPVIIQSSVPLGGGCINEVVRINTSAGEFVVKYNLATAFPGMFECEAAGLQLLRNAGEIHIPEVIHKDIVEQYSYLLLEFVPSGNRIHDFWVIFGRSLANLHKHTHSQFGLNHDNYIGSLPQQNRLHQDWTAFFIFERLEPMVRLARNKSDISSQVAGRFELLYSKLPNLIPVELPALLHGDLWNGNYIIDNKGLPCLIDPAVYFGHREMDLAMTRLFGGFALEFYQSYQDTFPLENEWDDRTDLFNLYPLLVHVNLFGGGYASQVKRILDHFV
jgi:protein-ribulosamine 3-kinase